jgi:hypothetical protein
LMMSHAVQSPSRCGPLLSGRVAALNARRDYFDFVAMNEGCRRIVIYP